MSHCSIKSTVVELSSFEREIEFQIPWEQIQREMDRAYQKIASKVQVKGFRPNKTPKHVLQQMYKERVELEAIEHLLEHGLDDAAKDHKLFYVSQAQLKETPKIEENKSLHLAVRVDVKPNVKAANYTGQTIHIPHYIVSEASIEQQLKALQKKQAKPHSSDEDLGKQVDNEESLTLAPLDDNFAKSIDGTFETLDDLKNAIRAELEKQKLRREENEMQSAIIDKLIELNSFALPVSMVLTQAQKNVQENLWSFTKKKDLFQNLWQKMGAELVEQEKVHTEKGLKGFLLIESIAEQEKLQITDQDLQKYLEDMAQKSNLPLEKVTSYFSSEKLDSLKPSLLMDKVFAFLRANNTLQVENKDF